MKTQTVALWLVVLLPLILLAAGIASGAWQEYRAWQDLQPVLHNTFAGVARRPLDRSRKELIDNQERRNLATVFSSLKAEAVRDEIRGPDGQCTFVEPKSSWEDAPLYARLAKKAKPAIDRLEKINNQTLATGSESPQAEPLQPETAHVLQVAMIDAFYRSDFDEAYRLLNVLATRNELFSIDIAANAQSFGLREQYILYAFVQDSLQYNPWTASQLDGLAKLIQQPVDWRRRLEAATRHQNSRIVANTLMAYDSQLVSEAKGGKYPWRADYDAIYLKNIIDAGKKDSLLMRISDFSSIDTVLREESQPTSTGGVFRPALPARQWNERDINDDNRILARAIATTESMRRMTLTALEIKRYQKLNGKWPAQLSDLYLNEKIPTWMMTINGVKFTYNKDDSPPVNGAVLQIDDDPFLQDVARTILYWHRSSYSEGLLRSTPAVLIR